MPKAGGLMDRDPEILAILREGFPRHLSEPVASVASILLPSRHKPAEPRIVRLGNEHLRIPYRIYNERSPGAVIDGPVEPTVLACILTRHHNGRERQDSAARLYPTRLDWVVPYVLLLIGEYVREILDDIEQAMPSMDLPAYRKVIADNPALWETTRRRVTSYWDVHYRRQFPQPRDYVGFRLLSALEGSDP